MLSFGFLLRRAAATYFDVAQSELRVGIRSVTKQPGDSPRVQLYIADTLANGAGYARHLGQPSVLNALMSDVVDVIRGQALEGMRGHFRDPAVCGTACYQCLLSYENLRYHGLMDWRLGMDVAEVVASGTLATAPNPRWTGRLGIAWQALGQGFARCEPVRGFEAADHGRESLTILVAPPMVERRFRSMHRDLLEAVREIEGRGRTAFVCSYFDLLHRPWWVVARSISALT
jgi:hypothetical protein